LYKVKWRKLTKNWIDVRYKPVQTKSIIREAAKLASASNVFNGKNVGEDIYHREVKGKKVKAENKRPGGGEKARRPFQLKKGSYPKRNVSLETFRKA